MTAIPPVFTVYLSEVTVHEFPVIKPDIPEFTYIAIYTSGTEEVPGIHNILVEARERIARKNLL